MVRAIEAGDALHTTGLVVQELLQGFFGTRDRARIIERFSALPLLVPQAPGQLSVFGDAVPGEGGAVYRPLFHIWHSGDTLTHCGALSDSVDQGAVLCVQCSDASTEEMQ